MGATPRFDQLGRGPTGRSAPGRRRRRSRRTRPMDLLHQLAGWALLTFNQHQLALLFVLLAIEESGIPIPVPGDTFVLLAGDQARHLGPHSLAVLAASTAAVVVGSSVLFCVVRWGGRPLVERYGRYLH